MDLAAHVRNTGRFEDAEEAFSQVLDISEKAAHLYSFEMSTGNTLSHTGNPLKSNKGVSEKLLGLVSIQRNRGRWLPEWFAFHYLVGFRKFYFYAHMCTDNTHEVLQKLARKLSITAISIPNEMDRVQLAAYQHACDHYMNDVDWLAFIDGDEFLFPTRDDSMQQALSKYQDLPISAVGAFNINFGSNGHIKEPDGLITENFRRRAEDDFTSHRRVKSIVKGRQKISVTACSNVFNTPQGTIDEQGRPITCALDRKSTRLNSSHSDRSRMPSSA